jgi:magnesium transporter
MQGTAVVILGVIGIVAFGSINSGLKEYFSLELLAHLWARPGWIGYFLIMTTLIVVQYICNTQLEAVYTARQEISVLPSHRTPIPRSQETQPVGYFTKVAALWSRTMQKLRDIMEAWTAPKDDKTIAWTLGIGWSCNGGAMAGGSLVFAKAT